MDATIPENAPSGQASEAPVRALLRGLPLVIAVGILVAALAAAASLTQEEKHQATAEAFVAGQTVRTSLGEVPQVSTESSRILATQAEVARLPEVAAAAVSDADAGLTGKQLLNNSSVTPDPDADLLSFVVTRSDPDLATRLANAYVSAYVKFRGRVDSKSARVARAGLLQRIDELEAAGRLSKSGLSRLLDRSERLRSEELERKSGSAAGAPATAAEKIQPQPVRNGILGGVLGLILGIGLLFARDALNTRPRVVDEIERQLDVPLLGRVPPPPKRLAESSSISSMAEPTSSEAEAYRMLATSIEVANLELAATSFIVVSATPGEGKSTTAANLAVVFAGRGANVALVEADLRHPTLRRLFDIEPGPGFGEVALGSARLDEALTSVELPRMFEGDANQPPGIELGRLQVLAANPTAVPADQLLQSEAASQILLDLDLRADLLLIDSPPMLQVGDPLTLMLSEAVDCALIAVRVGQVTRKHLREMRRMLSGAPTRALGFFATGVTGDENYPRGYGYDGAAKASSVAPSSS